MGRGAGCGGRDGMSERNLMGAQECGEKSRIETRLDFSGLLRSFFCDYVQPKRPFASRSLTISIRPNPANQKRTFRGRIEESIHHCRLASPLSTGLTTTAVTFEKGSPL